MLDTQNCFQNHLKNTKAIKFLLPSTFYTSIESTCKVLPFYDFLFNFYDTFCNLYPIIDFLCIFNHQICDMRLHNTSKQRSILKFSHDPTPNPGENRQFDVYDIIMTSSIKYFHHWVQQLILPRESDFWSKYRVSLSMLVLDPTVSSKIMTLFPFLTISHGL